MNPFINRCRGAGTYKDLAHEMWSLDDIYKIGHCDMVLLSALAVLDQIDFHKVEAYDNTKSQTEKVRNVPRNVP